MSIVYIRLAVPAAFIHGVLTRAPGDTPPPVRVPLLEKLLVRAKQSAEESDWRASAFDVLSLDAAAATAAAVQALWLGPVAESWVMVATPVHMTAGLSSVRLHSEGILRLIDDEIQLLIDDFNSIFSTDGLRLAALRGAPDGAAQCVCLSATRFDAATRDPQEALGSDVWAFQPTGADASRLRRLMSEIELWLFEHAVNRQRGAHGLPLISGLWLWGGGASIDTPPRAQGFCGGRDAILSTINPTGEWPHMPANGVVVLSEIPGESGWPAQERRWLVPAAAALRAGRLDELRLSLGSRCYSVRANLWRHFWRRSRAWWEYWEHE